MIFNTRCKLCDRECHVQVEIKNNQLLKIQPDKMYNKFLCPNGYNVKKILNNSKRIKLPMKKIMIKGVERWKEISWQEAMDYCGDRIQQNAVEYGKDSLFTVKGFNKLYTNLLFEMFSTKYGIKHQVSAGNMCHSARFVASKDIFGTMIIPKITAKTSNIILWGFNPMGTQRWYGMDILKACNNGCNLYIINPKNISLSELAKETYKIIPGRDRYLILALLYFILDNGLYSQKHIEVNMKNLHIIKSKILGMDFKQLLKLSSLTINEVKTLSQVLCNKGPCIVMTGNALDHNHDSYYKGLGISLLIALTGNYGIDGGMVRAEQPSNRNLFKTGKLTSLYDKEREILNKNIFNEKPLQHHNFQYYSGQEIQKKCLEEELTTGIIMGANPVVSWADSSKTIKAFKKLDFLVVQDFIFTPTAKLADVIFPTATYLERESLAIDDKDTIWYIPKLLDSNINRDSLDWVLDLMNVLSLDIPWKNSDDFWNYNLAPYGLLFDELMILEDGYRGVVKGGNLSLPGIHNSKLINFDIEVIPLVSWEEFLNMNDVDDVSAEYPYYCTNYKPSYRFLSMGMQDEHTKMSIALVSDRIAKDNKLKEGDKIQIQTKTGMAKCRVKIDSTIQKDSVLIKNGYWNMSTSIVDSLVSCANNLTDSSYNKTSKIPAFNTRGIPCNLEKI